jgi:hypothetical protein
MVLWAFSRYESHRVSFEDVPKRAITGTLIALLGAGVMVGYLVKPDVSEVRPADTLQKVK